MDIDVNSAPRLLVVGCGNDFAGDDGAGLEFVRRLGARGVEGVELMAATQPGVGLIDVFARAGAVLLVDAVASGAPPGTMHFGPLSEDAVEPRHLGRFSAHGWGVGEVMRLARALGREMPPMMLLGIEIGSVERGAPMTPEVERALTACVADFEAIRARMMEAARAG